MPLSGHLEVATELLDRGADPNAARTGDGVTALMMAPLSNHLEVATELLDRGADPNAAATG